MNIYISGLSYGIDSERLQNLFTEYGEVSSAKVITDRETGRSRGFGFVEMDDDAEGQNAINGLNGTQHDTRTINVSVARPQPERSSNQDGRRSYNNSRSY